MSCPQTSSLHTPRLLHFIKEKETTKDRGCFTIKARKTGATLSQGHSEEGEGKSSYTCAYTPWTHTQIMHTHTHHEHTHTMHTHTMIMHTPCPHIPCPHTPCTHTSCTHTSCTHTYHAHNNNSNKGISRYNNKYTSFSQGRWLSLSLLWMALAQHGSCFPCLCGKAPSVFGGFFFLLWNVIIFISLLNQEINSSVQGRAICLTPWRQEEWLSTLWVIYKCCCRGWGMAQLVKCLLQTQGP